jgi:hypothetical protein
MSLEAENVRLREALKISWEHAKAMRNASRVQGPHADRKDNIVWSRALYHEGKDLMSKLKTYRTDMKDEDVA